MHCLVALIRLIRAITKTKQNIMFELVYVPCKKKNKKKTGYFPHKLRTPTRFIVRLIS